MRIGIVTEYYYPSLGGVQEHVHHFAREARRLGHTVRIVTSAMPDLAPPTGDAAGPDVLRIARSRLIARNGSFGRVSGGIGLSGDMRRLLRRERFDVLHVHCPLTPVLPYVAIHHATCPVVGTFHTHFCPGLLFALTRRAQQRYLDRLDAALAVSRACLRAYAGELEADFRIVPNGVDVERFAKGRRLPPFDDGKMNVLWVGRIEPRNGLDVMVAAFRELRRDVDARLLVVGGGPLLPSVRARLPASLAPHVLFAGARLDDRPDWYASADVYCAPTRIASFGMTLLEAMAAERPTLASDIEGYRELITAGKEGELLPPWDARAWAHALVRLRADPARARAYGAQGRSTAQRYSWSLVASEVLGLYRDLGVPG